MATQRRAFDHQPLLSTKARNPAPTFKGLPKYPFVGGHNDPTCIPIQGFIDAAAEILVEDGQDLAIYNLGAGPFGYPKLRAHIADKLKRRRGIDVTIADVLITHGSNQGIDLTCDLLLDPGDIALVEAHSYSGALDRLRASGARLVPVELDGDGIVIADLESRLADLKADGIRPKMLYTIPTVQNPTGSILPLDRRHELLRLGQEYGFLILEDECYADLIWKDMQAPPSLYALDPSQVIHIGSFSKSLAPALRLGYAVAAPDILARLVAAKNRDGGTGALDQMITAAYFSRHYDAHVATMRSTLYEKMEVMVEAIQAEFGTIARIHKPKGGIYVWFDLPPEIDVRQLTAPAAKAGIAFSAGHEWSVDPEAGKSSIRLCFALPSADVIREGVAALATVCHEVYGQPLYSRNAPRG